MHSIGVSISSNASILMGSSKAHGRASFSGSIKDISIQGERCFYIFYTLLPICLFYPQPSWILGTTIMKIWFDVCVWWLLGGSEEQWLCSAFEI